VSGNVTPRLPDAAVQSVEAIGELTIVTIMTGNPWRENCHLVADRTSRQGILVDPGDCPDVILGAIADHGISVRRVILTHGHHDHVGAVTPVCRALGLPAEVNAADLKLAGQAPIWAYRFAGRRIERPTPLVPLTDADVQLGAVQGSVLATPGHTPGGICLCFPGLVVTGDTLLYQHVGRTDLPGGDIDVLRTSVSALLHSSSNDEVIFAGHGRRWNAAAAIEWWRVARQAPPVLDEHRELA
jgi:glyoxylase-like metal-dependent hydrolase (beta-lactamase superfamily II)